MATSPAKPSVDSLGGFDPSLTVPFGSSAPVRAAAGPTFEDYAATNPGATEEQYTDAMHRRAAAPTASPSEDDALTPFVRHDTTTTNAAVKKPSDGLGLSEIGATLGGAAVGSRVPNYVNPDLSAAKVDLARNAGYEQSLIKSLQGPLDQAHLAHQATQTALTDAAAIRDAAHAAAQAVGIDPEAISLAGDKWNKKVVGAMGPGGDSVTEAARNYRVEKGLPADYKATRSGLAVPRSYEEPVHVTNARQAVVDAELAHKTAQADAAAAKLALDKATAARNGRSVIQATAATQGAQATLDELSKARTFLAKIPGFNTIMGGLSAGELVHAYNEFQAGNTLEGVMAGLSGAGGLIGLVPHPAAKAAGVIMSLPPLAYQGYQTLQRAQVKNPDLDAFEPGRGDY